MTATANPNAPVKLPSRHFYRCADCLSVVATETRIPEVHIEQRKAQCAACGGRIEYMGETKRTIFGEDVIRRLQGYKCACDGKCINAVGPSCDCICGGVNHGSGRMVEVYVENGVPKVKIPADAIAKAEEYRRLVDGFKATYNAKYGEVNEMKRNGVFIRNWGFYMEGQYTWSDFLKAKAMRSHKGRNRRIEELTESIRKGVA